LKSMPDVDNPVAVSQEGEWPWELLDDCRRLFGDEVQPVLVRILFWIFRESCRSRG